MRGTQFAQGNLHTLDAAGKHGFIEQEPPDQEIWNRHQPAFAREPPHCLVGRGKREGLTPSQVISGGSGAGTNAL